MARLALALIVVALFAAAIGAVVSVLAPAERALTAARKGPDMPRGFQTIAFVLLLLLMLGVASGLVGAL